MLLSSSSLVIRVLPLMMLVCSIAHTFLSRWFVQLVLTPSSPKSDLRHATAWFLIHSLKARLPFPIPILLLVVTSTPTSTTDVFVLLTSCDITSHRSTQTPLRGLFLWVHIRRHKFLFLNCAEMDIFIYIVVELLGNT